MKNIFLKAGTAIVVAFLVACSGGDSPKGVAKNFLKAYSKADFEGAKKYGTEETGKLLDMLSGFSKMMPDTVKNKEVETDITSEKIDGDKATVTYKEDGKDVGQTLNLVKVDGKWKVAMSKDNMNGSANSIESGGTTTDTTAVGGTADPSNTTDK